MSKRAGCLVVLAVVLVIGGCLARFGGDDEQAAAPAPSVSQSVRPTPPAPEETEPTEASPTLPAGDEVTVIEVVDSATLKVADTSDEEFTVRVLGIQAPGECYADDAIEEAGVWLGDATQVVLQSDAKAGKTDKSGRRLAYVAVLSSVEVVDYGLLMIERGAARETGDGYSRQSEYRAAQKIARADKEGLWDKCKDEPTAKGKPTTKASTKPKAKPTQEPKDTTYYANCDDEARKAGAAPLRRGDPGYSTVLDRDGDGVACEN